MPLVASTGLLFYISQTARGEMLIGAEIDRQPSYSYRSGHHLLQSCSQRAMTLFPFLRDLRLLRQWTGVCDMSPRLFADHGQVTGVDGFYITTGWGTWGFKAIPAGGEQMARLDRQRRNARVDRALRDWIALRETARWRIAGRRGRTEELRSEQ
jgi:sarcosine oxidase subunit beta